MNNLTSVFSKRLSLTRQEKGYSQADVCKMGNFHKATYSNWENARRVPSIDDAKKLGRILEISPAYLLNLTDEKTKPKIKKLHEFQTIPLFSRETLKLKNWREREPVTEVPYNEGLVNCIQVDSFAFIIDDKSMAPLFQENDLVVFSPLTKAKHNDIVLIKVKATNDIMMRSYMPDFTDVDSPKVVLQANNPSFPAIKLDNPSQIELLGRVNNSHKIIF